MYVNAEEEILEHECEMVLDVAEEDKDASSVDMAEEEYKTSKKIMVFQAGKSERFMEELKKNFPV